MKRPLRRSPSARAIDVTSAGVTIDEDGRDPRDPHAGDRSRPPRPSRACRACAAVLVDRQRALGAGGGIVMEGRDIGTVVFPNADVKVYLDASAEERARRRAVDPAHTGVPAAVSEVATLLTERDQQDRTRAASPLLVAKDAVVVDTTGKSVDEVVER